MKKYYNTVWSYEMTEAQIEQMFIEGKFEYKSFKDFLNFLLKENLIREIK